jgi:hypothetical protein
MTISDKLSLSNMRKTVAVAASAAVILAATWASAAAATKTAAPKGATSVELGTGGLAASVGVPNRATSMISSMPTYCCPGYSQGGAQGLTTYGQASVKGQDTAARDSAIAKAIADATEQAKAAAAAAGLTLGKIIDMQVSAPNFGYATGMTVSSGASISGATAKGVPIPPAAPPGVSTGVSSNSSSRSASSGGSSAPSGSSVGGSPTCPEGAPCVSPVPMPVETFASVTITWAIN